MPIYDDIQAVKTASDNLTAQLQRWQASAQQMTAIMTEQGVAVKNVVNAPDPTYVDLPQGGRLPSLATALAALNAQNISNVHLENFTATAGQTVFTLAVVPISSGAVEVTLNGAVMQNGLDYSLIGATLTFFDPLLEGDRVGIRRFNPDGVEPVDPHTHPESEITDLDKYDQATVDTKVGAAQTAADTAYTTAQAADAKATTAQTTANAAQAAADAAQAAADTAQAAADAAQAAADAAQTTANVAISDAAAAQSTADGAVTDAATAQAAADAANANAETRVLKTGDTMTGVLKMDGSLQEVSLDLIGPYWDMADPNPTAGASLKLFDDQGTQIGGIACVIPVGGQADEPWIGMGSTSDNAGVLLTGPYIFIDSPIIGMGLPNAEVGGRVIVAGLTSQGYPILGLEPAPPPNYGPYEGTNATDFQIIDTNTLGPWIEVAVATITDNIPSSGYLTMVFWEILLDNLSIRTGRAEIGFGLNGALPSEVASQVIITSNYDELVGNTSVQLSSGATSGDTLTFWIRGQGDHNQFNLWARGTVTPAKISITSRVA